jgi:hypothetical protein
MLYVLVDQAYIVQGLKPINLYQTYDYIFKDVNTSWRESKQTVRKLKVF